MIYEKQHYSLMKKNSYSYYYLMFLAAREFTLKPSDAFALMFLEE
jgi:hypothetical protein